VWDSGAELRLIRPSRLGACDSRVSRCRAPVSVQEVCREAPALKVGKRWRPGPHELNRISGPSLELDSADHRSSECEIHAPARGRSAIICSKILSPGRVISSAALFLPTSPTSRLAKTSEKNGFDKWGRPTKVRIYKGRADLHRRTTWQRS
jgi:hypothetical protein